jgi:hypothetical protein
MSLRRQPMGRAVAATIVLAGTAAAVFGLQLLERQRAAEETAALIVSRAQQLRDLAAAHLATLELRGQSAGANPILAAALGGNVDETTLRDLFATESWWHPFRESFPATYVARTGDSPGRITGGADLPVNAEALVSRARASRSVASALLESTGRVLAVIAVPVPVAGAALTPVLLLTQPFEGSALGPLAERTGEAVMLSNGRRALVGAGPAEESAAIKRAIEGQRDGKVLTSVDEGVAIASSEVAPGLWLAGHVQTRTAVGRATAPYIAAQLAVGAVGAILFVVLLWSMGRSGAAGALAPSSDARSLVVGPPLAPGADSRYVLLQRLGGGGMAEVHLALAVGERGFRRPCVVKRLRPELASSAAAVAQFTDEATLASSLVHANIVPIFDFTRVGDQYLLVEEYIVGRDLGRLTRKLSALGRRLSPEMVAYIGVEALKALDYSHGKRDHDGMAMGIVHRDVSPENIMITLRGEVQLLDFGVLKVEGGRRPGTEVGELKGSLAFMAPEQARGLEVDGRADLFALGLVLYYCLTGEPLYGAETGYDLLLKAASGPGPIELAKLAALPQPFPGALYRVLSARPEGRYLSAFAFAEVLVPSVQGGALRMAELMTEVFGEELGAEQQQLAASSFGLGSGLRPGDPRFGVDSISRPFSPRSRRGSEDE